MIKIEAIQVSYRNTKFSVPLEIAKQWGLDKNPHIYSSMIYDTVSSLTEAHYRKSYQADCPSEVAKIPRLNEDIQWAIFKIKSMFKVRKNVGLALGCMAVCLAVSMMPDSKSGRVNYNPVAMISVDSSSVEEGEIEDLNVGSTLSKKAKKAAKKKENRETNDAAPISTKGLSVEQANAYIKRFAPVAISEMKKFGIPASISLAQGLVESRGGLSTLARRNNNHFGMKCFSRNCHKGHCSNYTDDSHKDFFRIYKNSWESWRAHSEMLANPEKCYSRLKKHGKDYKKWAYGLKACKYATDKPYAEKLIGMIERYELYKYDR